MRTPPSQSPELRLLTITEAIEDWIARLGPSVVSIERVFAQDNLRSVIGVAQVMGTAMAAAARRARGCGRPWPGPGPCPQFPNR